MSQVRRQSAVLPRPNWGWQDAAACKGEDLLLFFGPDGERQPELGVGAIAEGLETAVYDASLLARLSLSPADLAPVVAAEQAELTRRVQVYRGGRPLPRVAGQAVIVVDDGLATGVTARAALRSLRAAQAAYLVLAAPVAAPAAAGDMRAEANQVIILATPRRFRSVGQWYTSFGQLTDADVLALLG